MKTQMKHTHTQILTWTLYAKCFKKRLSQNGFGTITNHKGNHLSVLIDSHYIPRTWWEISIFLYIMSFFAHKKWEIHNIFQNFSGTAQKTICSHWGGPGLDTEFEVWPHQCWRQGDPCPCLAGHTISDITQDIYILHTILVDYFLCILKSSSLSGKQSLWLHFF